MAKASKNQGRLTLSILVAFCVAAGYWAWSIHAPQGREVATARVERREFLTTVRARGELKSTKSVVVTAPATPDLKIVRLAENGKPIEKGEVVVAFDASTEEERYTERRTEVRQVDSKILQAEAQHAIADEQYAMAIMTSEYNVERAKLEASKQEILSEIEGLKNRIDVGIAQGELSLASTTAEATDLSQMADLNRLEERKQKALRDLERSKTYLQNMVLRAPSDGIVIIKDNHRAQGSFGRSRPPFQEGDTVWAGAEIAEIPDLSSMRVEFRLEEIDRGRVKERQPVRIRVDAVPDVLLEGRVAWLSPIATLVFRRFPPEKNFPAHASIRKLDRRLRPDMSATVEVIVDRRPDVLVIPSKASFQIDGRPTVFVASGGGFVKRQIKVSARNANEIVVEEGLQEGESIALENPELIAPSKQSSESPA